MDSLQIFGETGNANDTTDSIFLGGQVTGMMAPLQFFLGGAGSENYVTVTVGLLAQKMMWLK
jgi:hypothetical protein